MYQEKSASTIREMKRRQKLAAELDQDICRRCFQTDHKRQDCREIPVVACAKCFICNIFTTQCCERGEKQEIFGMRQHLRFAGHPVPRLFVDVIVMTMKIPALFDPGSVRSRIDPTLAMALNTYQIFADSPNFFMTKTGMAVPIGIDGKIFPIDCLVTKLDPTIHLALGMDYFSLNPFNVTFDHVTLNSKEHWTTSHHEETTYVYNLPKGKDLKKLLKKHDFPMKEPSRQQALNRYKQSFSNDPQRNHRYY